MPRQVVSRVGLAIMVNHSWHLYGYLKKSRSIFLEVRENPMCAQSKRADKVY